MVYNLGDMNLLDLLIERIERRKEGSSIHSVHSVLLQHVCIKIANLNERILEI